jgi:crossover junction endodeoxyribonuclease RuvC
MSTQTICGVDPGATGGIAFVDALTGALVAAYPMPMTKDGKVEATLLTAYLNGHRPVRAYVENVSSRPRQAGQFSFGVSTGIVHGVLGARGVPFALVAPQSWKGAYGIKRAEGQTKRDTKSEARFLAAKLFPDHASKFSKVKDDGVAEAALIALYGLNVYIQE